MSDSMSLAHQFHSRLGTSSAQRNLHRSQHAMRCAALLAPHVYRAMGGSLHERRRELYHQDSEC